MFNFTIKRFKSLINHARRVVIEKSREYHDSRIAKYAVVAYNETSELEKELCKLISDNKEFFFNVINGEFLVVDIERLENDDNYCKCRTYCRNRLILTLHIPKDKIIDGYVKFDEGKDILIRNVVPTSHAYKNGDEFYDDYWHDPLFGVIWHIFEDLYFFKDDSIDIKTLKDAKLTMGEWEHIYRLAKNTKRRTKILIAVFKHYLKDYGIYF